MDIKELEMMTDRISSAFTIKEITYCTHDDPDNCDCRKPKPGMILELLKKYTEGRVYDYRGQQQGCRGRKECRSKNNNITD